MERRDILTLVGDWRFKTLAAHAASMQVRTDTSILYMSKSEKVAMLKIILDGAMKAASDGDFDTFEINVGIADALTWWIMLDHDRLYEGVARDAVFAMKGIAKIISILEKAHDQ